MRKRNWSSEKLAGQAASGVWRRASEKMEKDERNQVNTASSMKIIPRTRSNCLPIGLQDPIS